MKKEEKIWLAGLLEGEGWFGCSPRGNSVNPQIYLQMCDLDVVEKAAKIMGARAPHLRADKLTNPKHSPSFVARLRGRDSIPVMKAVLPYMGKRRAQKIRECVRKWESRPIKSERPKESYWPKHLRIT